MIFRFLHSMPGRMVTGILLMNFVLGAALITGVMHFIRSDYEERFVNQVRGQSQILSLLVGQDARQDRVAALLGDIQLSGEVVYARFDPAGAEDRTFKEDLAFGANGDKVYHLSVPVSVLGQGSEMHDILRLGYDETFIGEKIRRLYFRGSVVAAIYLVLLSLVSIMLAKRLTRPFTELQRASREIADGDIHRTLSVSTKLTEINELANDLEFMRRETLRHLFADKFAAADVWATQPHPKIVAEPWGQN